MRNFDYSVTVAFLGDFFAGTDELVEFRAIHRENGAVCRPLITRNPTKVIEFCERWDVPGIAVYFGIATRSNTRSGKREDLSELPGLWVDIDCAKIGITIDDAALALRSAPLPPSVIVMSGHGVHAYWLFREKLDALAPPHGEADEIKERVDAVLKQLAGTFAGDLPVCQIAAVMRLPGTHNSKTDDIVPVVIIEENWVRHELDDIEEMLFRTRPLIVPASPELDPFALARGLDAPPEDPFLAFAAKYQFRPPLDVEQALRDMKLGGFGGTSVHKTQLSVSASLIQKGVEDTDIVEMLLRETSRAVGLAGERWNWRAEEKNLYGMCAGMRVRLAREGKIPPEAPQVRIEATPTGAKVVQLRPREQQPEPDTSSPAAAEASKPEKDPAPQFLGFPLNDLGNAMRLLSLHRPIMRYVLGIGWHLWDKRRFAYDQEASKSQLLAHRTVREMFNQAFSARTRDPDDKAHAAVMKFAVQCGNSGRLANMLTEASPHVALPADVLDADPMLLNCKNGTLDLRSGELRDHNQADLLTKLCGAAYDPDATCPRWEQFLLEIFGGDADLVGFVQRGLGYSLTGDISEQIVFILHGTGANGKSVLIETVSAVLDEYVKHSPTDTWISKPAGAATNDLAALVGARFVSVVETEQDRHLAEALVKQATGGDKITARFHHKEFFSYLPQFKLWFATNHRPKIRGSDHAIWRRIVLLPFLVKFFDADEAGPGQMVKDPGLTKSLRFEHAGILAWMVRGCLEWQRIGLRPPVAVKAAVAAYQEAEDNISGFMRDACHQARGIEISMKLLYAGYRAWCEENDSEAKGQREFGKNLDDRGFPPGKRTMRDRLRQGIDLTQEYRDMAEAWLVAQKEKT